MYVVFDTEAKDVRPDFKENGISYVSFYRSDTGELSGYFEDEILKLRDLFQKADTIIGYNIYGYDFPVTERYFPLSLNGKVIVDIFKEIVKQHNLYLKLDNIAQTTLNKGKIAHGLDAVRFFKEGNLDKLKEYCNMDVELTKEVYEFILNNGYFLYTDGTGNEHKLDLALPRFEEKKEDFGLF